MSQPYRGKSGRGGGGAPRRGRGSKRGSGFPYGGGFPDSDCPRSPDRCSTRSENAYPPPSTRFNNYRHPSRPMSRSPSPPPPPSNYRNNEWQNDRYSDRGPPRSMPRSPDYRQRQERRYENGPPESTSMTTGGADATFIVAGKETARIWKLRIADAEEEVRRMEFKLHRAKLDLEAIQEAYQEYTETTVPQDLLKPKQNW
uniref:DUF1421 multi-domain protein n=1 Tax=Caenorhabditis tropicalis TaxID=1561998 RepID=A0A1I7U484_9PELO